MTTVRGRMLDDAKHAIEGDRNKQYGDPRENFQDIADLWNLHFAGKLADDEGFYAEDIAVAMILTKVARMRSGVPNRDNWLDIAGYAACGHETETDISHGGAT